MQDVVEERIECPKCGHQNNPLLETCFKCNTLIDSSYIVTEGHITASKPWFDFIHWVNSIAIVMFFISGIMAFIFGIKFIGFSGFLAGIGYFFLGFVLIYLEIGLSKYDKAAREGYILFLAILGIFSWITDSIASIIIILMLIYAIAINEDNIKHYNQSRFKRFHKIN